MSHLPSFIVSVAHQQFFSSKKLEDRKPAIIKQEAHSGRDLYLPRMDILNTEDRKARYGHSEYRGRKEEAKAAPVFGSSVRNWLLVGWRLSLRL